MGMHHHLTWHSHHFGGLLQIWLWLAICNKGLVHNSHSISHYFKILACVHHPHFKSLDSFFLIFRVSFSVYLYTPFEIVILLILFGLVYLSNVVYLFVLARISWNWLCMVKFTGQKSSKPTSAISYDLALVEVK